MTNWFVDSSVLIRAINGDSPAAHRWFSSSVKDGDALLGSRLLEVEVLRYAVNTETDISKTQEYLDRFSFIEITKDVIAAAIAIPVPVGGADSIHVGSALKLERELAKTKKHLVIATHDAQMARAAEYLGLTVIDPVTDDPRRAPVA